MVGRSNPVAVTSNIAPVSSKNFLDIPATTACSFIFKCVRDMIRTYRVKNVIVFDVGNSSLAHGNDKNKIILILGKGPRDGLDDTTITAEAESWFEF